MADDTDHLIIIINFFFIIVGNDGQAVVDCRKRAECRLLVRTDLRLYQHIFADKVVIAHKNILLQQNSKPNYQKVR